MALVAQLSISIPTPCVWHFDGFGSPALDLLRDDKPPRIRGVLVVPIGIVLGSFVEESERSQRERQAAEIVTFYRTQGITASDLQRMVADDVRQRVPIGVIRARADVDIPDGSRGTVSRMTGPLRTIDNTVVPNEPPP